MRPAILVLSALLILEACSTSLAPALPSHGASAPTNAPVVALERAVSVVAAPLPVLPTIASHDAVAPAAASPAIDLGSLAQIVAALPRDLYRFEIDLYICAGAIVAIGIVNAFLIASLLASRRRVAASAHASDAHVPSPAETPSVAEVAPTHVAVVTTIEDVVRSCACGAAIALRSKTGRCRRCATASRSKRPLHEVATATA